MRQSLQSAKRIVIKVGTSSLIHPNGMINLAAIDELAFVLTDLRNKGKEIILVSSGCWRWDAPIKLVKTANFYSRTTSSRGCGASSLNEYL